MLSAIDQFAFGSEFGDVLSTLSPHQVYDRLLDASITLQEKYTAFPIEPYSSSYNTDEEKASTKLSRSHLSLLSHTHFINYGAGYYSYLLAKMYSSHIFDRHFKVNVRGNSASVGTKYVDDLLSLSSGRKVWESMLIHGAAKDPTTMLNDLVGGTLNPVHYLEPVLNHPIIMYQSQANKTDGGGDSG